MSTKKNKIPYLDQKYYEEIISLMPGHVYWVDKNGVFLGCNMQQAKDAGFNSPIEMIGKTNRDMPWSNQASYLEKINQKVMQSKKPLTLEELFELPNGTKKIYLTKKTPLYDDNNEVSGILGISFDITERKQLEQDLANAKKLAEKTNEDIISSMPGHVYWKNKNGVFLGCNMQQAKDAGFNSPQDIIGKTREDMPWSNQTTYLDKIDQKVMRSKKPLTIEELFELPDGTKKIYLTKKTPLYDENNEISGILGISFDITERKELEQKLVEAKEIAEKANKVKTEFLENMRHDLRTPLTGIIGFAEIIKSEAQSTQVKEHVENLVTASHTLLDFLNDILEAMKVLSGDMPMVRKKFSLQEIVNKIICLIKPTALERKLALNLDYSDTIPKYLIGDPIRIQRILLELIANALKYTHKGSITVTIELAKRTGHQLVIKCAIQDTGIGIPEDKQDEIFLRFKRLSPSYEGIYKGFGLGLSIVKQFIDEMQGEIYCKSKIGQGSTFICLIPLQESLLDDDDNVAKIKLNSRATTTTIGSLSACSNTTSYPQRILIVEDQPLAAKVAQAIITSLGYLVDIAENGRQALACYNKNQYDLILMDIGLPDVDGVEVTKKIRAQEYKHHVPIVALTAHVDSDNKAKCLEAGLDEVLTKPLTPDIAKKTIIDFTSKVLSKSAPRIKETKEIKKPKKLELNLNKMLAMLIEGFKEDEAKFFAAKQNNNWDAIKKLVHKYRGGSSYCDVPKFQQACAKLEDYIAENKTRSREKLYQQLFAEMDKLREQANPY